METLDQAMSSLFPAPRYSFFFGKQIHLAQILGTAQFAEWVFSKDFEKRKSPK